jgi:hypothetical protein
VVPSACSCANRRRASPSSTGFGAVAAGFGFSSTVEGSSLISFATAWMSTDRTVPSARLNP